MTYSNYQERLDAEERAKQARAAKAFKRVVLVGLLMFFLVLSGCTLINMGTTIEPGHVGVKVSKFSRTNNVDPSPATSGWRFKGIGVRYVQFPVIQRTFAYANQGENNDRSIHFTDRTGLGLSADVTAIIQVQALKAPALFVKHRLTFEELVEGPIRNDIRTAIVEAAETRSVEQFLAGGRQAVMQEAFAKVQKKWAAEGVDIKQLSWTGQIQFPRTITNAIQARTEADQKVLAAQAQVAVAEAQAREKVAIAEGDADAYRLRGEALRANPQVLEQQEISKWSGLCPRKEGTCVLGEGASTLVQTR